MSPCRLQAQGDKASDPSVTALDIFFACRHPDAFKTSTDLYRFCALPLPTSLATAAEVTTAWTSAEPPRPDALVGYREDVLKRQNERRAAAATVQGVRSADLAGGEIVFPEGSALTEAMRTLLASAVLLKLNTLKDNLGVEEVVVVGHAPLSESQDAAEQRARSVLEFLDKSTKGFKFRDTVATYPPTDPANRGRVTIHVRLPRILASEFATMEAVRFDSGGFELDDGGRLLVGAAADEIRSRSDFRNGAIVEVRGYPDRAGEADTILAWNRAATLKATLVEFGVPADQILMARNRTPRTNVGRAGRSSAQSGWLSLGTASPGDRLAAPAAAQTSGTGFSLGWEAVAQAATDAIVARAERELQQYMLAAFVRRLCEKTGRDALRETCLALQDQSSGRYLPSLETIRSLLKRDVERLPEHAVVYLLSNRLQADSVALSGVDSAAVVRVSQLEQRLVSLQQRERPAGSTSVRDAASPQCVPSEALPCTAESTLRLLRTARQAAANAYEGANTEKRRLATAAVMALYAFEFAKRVHRGDDPLGVLVDFDGWLDGIVADHQKIAYVRDLPALASMGRFSRLAGETRSAAEHLRTVSSGTIPRDTLLRYAALQLLANSKPDARLRFASEVAQLVEARRMVEDIVPALDSIRRRVAALQTYGESTRPARRELYASALDQLVQIGVAGFMATAGVRERERLQDLRSNLSGLVFAIRTESYAEVLEQSLALLQSMTPPAPACDKEECTPTPIMESVRFLTLAVDVSEATSEDDLRGAMARFVDEGGGVAAKRSGRPTWGLHLNSYVGAGFGGRFDDGAGFLLRLPVGAEVVYRRSGWAPSGLVQLVDLGGFLPQQGDDSDRTGDERLADVLSPGAFLMLPIGSLPVSFGAGVAADTRVNDQGEWDVKPRWVLFVGVDVPLLRIR